jgi:hypothetical protein
MSQPYPPPQPPYGQPDPRQWQGYAQQPPPPAPKKRKWPWVVGAILLLFVIAGIAGGNSEPAPSSPAAAVPADPAPADDVAEAAAGSTVVYEVLGQGTANNVTYMKEGFSQEQQTEAKLPFRKELQFKDEVGSFAPLSLVAQNGSRGGDITCRITVDGKVVGESTSSGQYAVVTCNGNG